METYLKFVQWVSDHWRVVGPIILVMTIGLMIHVGRTFLREAIDDIRDCWE